MTVNFGSLLWGLGLGLGGGWVTWIMYDQFAQLESGHLESMRIWAPLAWIYNIGGVWSSIAKWAALAMTGGLGVGGVVCVVAAFMPERAAEAPADPADRGHEYDAVVTVMVTQAQVASQAEIEAQGPLGPVRVKLPAPFNDLDIMRVRGAGIECKGDLFIHFVVV